MKKTIALIVILALLGIFSAEAADYSYALYGSQFSSVSGYYVTTSHCSADQCGWVSGGDIVLYSDGKAEYTFSLGSIANDATSAEVKVAWKPSTDKGLHSTIPNGYGFVYSNGNYVGGWVTSVARCGSHNDYFAHSCTTTSLSASIPAQYISDYTKIALAVSNAYWDVNTVTLTVHTAPCSSSTDLYQTATVQGATKYCRDMGSGYHWYTNAEIESKCAVQSDIGKIIYGGTGQAICTDAIDWKNCGKYTAGTDCALQTVNSVKYQCLNLGYGHKWYTASQMKSYCTQSSIGWKGSCGYGEYACNDYLMWAGCGAPLAGKVSTPIGGKTYYCKQKSSGYYVWDR